MPALHSHTRCQAAKANATILAKSVSVSTLDKTELETDRKLKALCLTACGEVEREPIDEEKLKLHPSRDYHVVINGKKYPPNEVMRFFANLIANGIIEWSPCGGEPTHKYLKNFGFIIEEKI